MNEEKIGKKILSYTVRALIAAVITFGFYYVILPPINPCSESFWMFLFLTLVIFSICLGVFNLKRLGQIAKQLDGNSKKQWQKRSDNRTWEQNENKGLLTGGIFARVCLIILVVPIAVVIIGSIVSSTMFNAKGYASVITVSERDFKEDMPEVNEITNIALMDTDSARILGNRKLGALASVVSQYVASDSYTQINYQGRPMKITNLEYDGFFKWLNNKSEGIPGYIMVDTLANSAEYYELEEGMIYVPSGYFSHDLTRKLRFDYPTKIFQNISFEADENGKVYYIVSCASPRVGLFGAMDIDEVIIFDPVTGESELYALSDVPTWVDIVFDGYLACEKYDWQGTLSGGFINSVIGNKGCKQTTDDFGYIMLDDDVWYFTGVTSVTADESNIGFILSCARTGEYKFYPVIGAEEYSAMGAAQGDVQEKGYVASFPSLVNIAGEPTYIMVLKDANGLVKLYALVNVRQYNIVATGETQSEAIAAYTVLLAQSGIDTSQTVIGETKTVTVAEARYLTLSGVPYVYLTDTEGDVYRVEFNEANESIIFVGEGDKISVTYTIDEKTGIRPIREWKFEE